MQENINIPDSTITTNLSFRQLVLMNMQQLTNFPYIEKDFDALTDYELLSLVVKFLNDVIANQNEQNDSITRMYQSFLALQDYVNNTKDELEDAFNNLDNYVRDYFDNLDVQEEINNKLDQMLKDGVLEQIIEQFLQLTSLICFNDVASMKVSPNLTNGSYAKTLGYLSINDGGGATYKIRTKTNADVIDEGSIINISETLVAELIIENKVNVLNFGYTMEEVTYDERTSNVKNITDGLKNAITYLITRETNKGNDGGTIGVQIYFPDDFYYIDDTINLNNQEISLLGDSPALKRVNFRIGGFRQKILTNVDGAVFSNGQIHFRGLNFENILTTNTNETIFSSAKVNSMQFCHANNYECVMNNIGGVATIDSNYFLNCRKYFCNGTLSDSIVTNNYINAAPELPNTICFNSTTIGMSLIAGNFIDFFKKGINVISQCVGARFVDNTFDYIYQPIVAGGVLGLTISNNSFNHISKDYYERLFFESTSTQATTNWNCIETTSTIRNLSITGNTVNNSDAFVKVPNTNETTQIITQDNALEDFSKFGTFSISAQARGNHNIKFLDVNEKDYSVAPSNSNTYLGQVVYYNGFTYKNYGSVVKCIGVKALENGVDINYTAQGGGNYTIDFTDCLNSGLLGDVRIQISTTHGYYTPTIAIYSVRKIGGGLVVSELSNNSTTNYKTVVSSTGTTLNISFTGSVEESTESKQVLITNA